MFTPPALRSASNWAGLRIGILGGTFNPPHQGHLHISLQALKRLDLDCVWWLAVPQNPLKAGTVPKSMQERIAECRRLTASHPRLVPTDLEARIAEKWGTRNTWETVCHLERAFPQTRFVWIGGTDLAVQMHRWQNWRSLTCRIAFAFFARPPANSLIRATKLRMRSELRHVFPGPGESPSLEPGTVNWFKQTPMMALSSTEIRNKISP